MWCCHGWHAGCGRWYRQLEWRWVSWSQKPQEKRQPRRATSSAHSRSGAHSHPVEGSVSTSQRMSCVTLPMVAMGGYSTALGSTGGVGEGSEQGAGGKRVGDSRDEEQAEERSERFCERHE